MAEDGIRADELAQHCSKNDCWVSVNGKVYDITALVAAVTEDDLAKAAYSLIDSINNFTHVPSRCPAGWAHGSMKPCSQWREVTQRRWWMRRAR